MDALLDFERSLWARGMRYIAGVDEAGRGPLAGPVVAAAVVVPEGVYISGVDDSKKLSAARREVLYDAIRETLPAIGVGIVDHKEIDRTNILIATMRAMQEAVAALTLRPDWVLVDGNRTPEFGIPADAIIDGDARCFSIAAASIIAKVTRDRIMVAFDSQYPGYGFAIHKGYGTRAHRLAIAERGYCPIHRRTFSCTVPGDAHAERA